MKKALNWQLVFALSLIALSVAFYFLHYWLFRDAHHIFLYLVGDIAFLFLDVLIVMLILHQLLEYRDKQSVLKKLNMVIGVFFSEVGTELLKRAGQFTEAGGGCAQELIISGDWTARDFTRAEKKIKAQAVKLDSQRGDLAALRDLLVGKRPFLLNLLENPNLLEHESFTELLWAVFHLADELLRRKDIRKLPATDQQHLAIDMQRAYKLLLLQWLNYMKHLQRDYPYLFSLAVRTNPFDDNASVEVK